jgi:quinol monooxygenase YgiN
MAFVVIATWKARAGEEGRIREVLRHMSSASRKEPGCRAYQAQVSLQDPTRFLLYERYDDPRAFASAKYTQGPLENIGWIRPAGPLGCQRCNVTDSE